MLFQEGQHTDFFSNYSPSVQMRRQSICNKIQKDLNLRSELHLQILIRSEGEVLYKSLHLILIL